MDYRPTRLFPLLPALFLVACAEPTGSGFALPEGDVATGQALFVSYGCIGCHEVLGMDLPRPEAEGPVRVVLGGRVSRLQTYPELVTAIVNPSHRLIRARRADEVSQDGESLMVVYNDVMTVTELINLVAFLESRYEEFERPGYRYMPYSTAEPAND